MKIANGRVCSLSNTARKNHIENISKVGRELCGSTFYEVCGLSDPIYWSVFLEGR